MLKAVLKTALAVAILAATPAIAQETASTDDKPDPVRRPGSVDLHQTYDMSDLQIPEDEIHTLLPRDAIPALTDPKLEDPESADWLTPLDRVIVVSVNGETIAAPLRILNWHEVANLTLAGEPVAATYCPLCDSATVISRRITTPDGEQRVLEFGVSGALYNSNVLMYDQTGMALWSQLGMHAVSGPLAGTTLTHLPARIITWGAFRLEHPEGRTISVDTGHERDYANADPYKWFFDDPERLLVPIQNLGDELPPKTLGVGIATNTNAWFVPADVIGDAYTLTTNLGDVVMATSEAGIVVQSAPKGVRTAQTFYYSWSAFNPATTVVNE